MQAAFETYSTSKNNSMKTFDGEGNVFWFSYKTLVAFKKLGSEVVCIQNYWKQTTGIHLNHIEPDKSKRVTKETFDRIYQESFSL